ncbi:MAG: hypothetical protein KDA61_21695, partial [Planctomycetales bacterium]|nr:hypothetical protein [Planctomycetales bacterium]
MLQKRHLGYGRASMYVRIAVGTMLGVVLASAGKAAVIVREGYADLSVGVSDGSPSGADGRGNTWEFIGSTASSDSIFAETESLQATADYVLGFDPLGPEVSIREFRSSLTTAASIGGVFGGDATAAGVVAFKFSVTDDPVKLEYLLDGPRDEIDHTASSFGGSLTVASLFGPIEGVERSLELDFAAGSVVLWPGDYQLSHSLRSEAALYAEGGLSALGSSLLIGNFSDAELPDPEETYYWRPTSVSDAWAVEENWTPEGGPPTRNDVVVFDQAGEFPVTLLERQEIDRLDVTRGVVRLDLNQNTLDAINSAEIDSASGQIAHLQITDGTFDSSMFIARHGKGKVTVSAGGTIESGVSTMAVAEASQAELVVTSDGQFRATNLQVGAGGHAVARVENGGRLVLGRVVVGNEETGLGELVVEGAQSELTVLAMALGGDSHLIVGAGGPGSFTLADRAQAFSGTAL